VFLGLLFKIYWVSVAGFLITVALVLSWTRGRGLLSDWGAIDVGHGERAPTQYEGPNPPSWWALAVALVANGGFFASLLFGVLFLWVVAPGWPPPEVLSGGTMAGALAALGLATAAAGGRAAAGQHHGDAFARRRTWLLLCATGHALALGGLAWIGFAHLPDPTSHSYVAASGALLVYSGLHAFIGFVFAVYGHYRDWSGYVSPARTLDLRIGTLWHTYTAATGLVALFTVVVLPLVIGS
jgi:cytochrome c oxidase subunit I+III